MKQLKNEAESRQSCVSVSVTDLKIGNYYSYDDNAIKLDGSLLATYLQNDTDLYLYTIPLTEEWLKKFGFTQCENEFWYEKGFIGISLDGLVNLQGRGYNDVDLSTKVKTINHLQDLYFCLTGSELQIGNLTEH